MKRFLLSLIFSVVASLLFGQDAIYKRDNVKIDCKVLEVGISEIKYKPTSNPDGPIYSLNKSDVVLIIYQNGSHEVFSSAPNTSAAKTDSLKIHFCRNFIGIDVGEFVNNSIGLIYEHTFGKDGLLSFRIPFSVGINSNSNSNSGYPTGKIFNTGFDLLYFPTGQGVFKYYAAPYFEWGIFNERYYNYNYYYSNQMQGQHLAGGLKNGVQYNPTRHFCFSADFGLGIQKQEMGIPNQTIQPQYRANVIVGYRF